MYFNANVNHIFLLIISFFFTDSPICSFSGVQKHAVRIGDHVSLTCRVTANPNNVTMRWRYIRNNAPIKSGLLGTVESQTVSSSTILIDIA